MAGYNDTIQFGGDMMTFISSGATKLPLAFSTSAKLDMNKKLRDISSKDSGNSEEYTGVGARLGWTASSDGFMAYTSGSTLTGTTPMDVMFNYFKAGQPVNFVFGCKTGNAPGWTVNSSVKAFTGQVLIENISISSNDGENVTYSVNFRGTGDLLNA